MWCPALVKKANYGKSWPICNVNQATYKGIEFYCAIAYDYALWICDNHAVIHSGGVKISVERGQDWEQDWNQEIQ